MRFYSKHSQKYSERILQEYPTFNRRCDYYRKYFKENKHIFSKPFLLAFEDAIRDEEVFVGLTRIKFITPYLADLDQMSRDETLAYLKILAFTASRKDFSWSNYVRNRNTIENVLRNKEIDRSKIKWAPWYKMSKTIKVFYHSKGIALGNYSYLIKSYRKGFSRALALISVSLDYDLQVRLNTLLEEFNDYISIGTLYNFLMIQKERESNKDFDDVMQTPDEWLVEIYGVNNKDTLDLLKRRHF